MDLGGLWRATRTALAEASRDLVGFAIAAGEAILAALVVILIGRFVRRRVERALARSGLDRNVAMLAANGVTIATYLLTVSVVLAVLGASWTALGALLGAGTVAVTLALQDVLRSVVAGLYLLVERPFAIGDRIRVREVEGDVERIDIRTTSIRADGGERVLVPNATVFAEIVTNRSVAGEERLLVTAAGLADRPESVAATVAAALHGLPGLGGRPPTVEVVAAGGEGVDVTIAVGHRADRPMTAAVVGRLRERFPMATVTVGRG